MKYFFKFRVTFVLLVGYLITNGGSMKQMLKMLSLLAVLATFSQGASASSKPETESLYSELKVNAFTVNLGLITDKFSNYGGADLTFNSEFIQLKINKRSNCKKDQPCTMSIPAPEIIKLSVSHVLHEQCRDVYYAATSSAVKSKIYEQMRIADYSVGRCQTFEFAVQNESRLQYKVTGASSLINEANSAGVDFILKNVQILLPTE